MSGKAVKQAIDEQYGFDYALYQRISNEKKYRYIISVGIGNGRYDVCPAEY